MKRVSPEDAVGQHEMDVETEKAAARLNLFINVAIFVALVGGIRISEANIYCFIMSTVSL